MCSVVVTITDRSDGQMYRNKIQVVINWNYPLSFICLLQVCKLLTKCIYTLKHVYPERSRCEPGEVSCQDFAGHLLPWPLRLLGIRGLQNRRATKTSWRLQKRPAGGCGSRGGIRGALCRLDTSRRLIISGGVAWARVILGSCTDDMFKQHQKMYFRKNFYIWMELSDNFFTKRHILCVFYAITQQG